MSEQQATAGAAAGTVHYGGFWIRVLAAIVDAIILNIVFWLLMVIFGVSMFEGMMSGDPAAMEMASGTGATIQLVGLLIGLAYAAGFIASPLQATPGKLLVKLKVTDNAGQRLGIGRAVGRELAKYISAIILLIGFIMVAFADRKRGLHDMIASTLVMYRM